MINILLNGIVLPLMATWFVPDAIEKKGAKSAQLLVNLLIVFFLSIAVYLESKGMVAIFLGVINCGLVYLGGVTYLYFKKKRVSN